MTRHERMKAGLYRPGEVASICGVAQSVLRHHYRAGHVPAPARIDGKMYFTRRQVRVIRAFFAGRTKYQRAAVRV